MSEQENGLKKLLGFEETEKMSDEELDAYLDTLPKEEAQLILMTLSPI